MPQRIQIVRGTTNTFEISVVDSAGGAYVLGSNERVVFGVKADPKDRELIITKTAEVKHEGLFQVVLDPEDTADLDFGRYWYDVGLDNGTMFFNIIKPSPFVISENVTFRGCVG